MHPYRRIFTFEPHFPFQYIYRDIKLTQHELPDHVHDWFELVYVHEGEGTFFIDHSFYEATAGSIFLIPGNTIHRSFPNDENPKLSSAIYFSPAFVNSSSILSPFNYLHIFQIIKIDHGFKIILPVQQQLIFEQYFNAIHHEYMNKAIGYEHQIQHYVQHMLITLTRHKHTSEKQINTASNHIPSWIVHLFTYIEHHLYQELPLHVLAKHVSVSPPHLSRVFKQYTGMNITSYVNAKKIMKAKDLLLYEDLSVNEVADQCGFGSMTHFHRIFKRATGLAPNQFKKTFN